MAKQKTQKDILSAIESLTLSVGKLTSEVAEIKASKKPLLESLEITTGKLPDDEQESLASEKIDRVQQLEEVLNTKKTNPYGTTELSIFEQRLQSMTLADLQNLAYKVGENQNYQPAQLRKALKNSFILASKNFGGELRQKPQPVDTRLDSKNPKHLKLMRMLGVATQ